VVCWDSRAPVVVAAVAAQRLQALAVQEDSPAAVVVAEAARSIQAHQALVELAEAASSSSSPIAVAVPDVAPADQGLLYGLARPCRRRWHMD
jgi:hypothetical protein